MCIHLDEFSVVRAAEVEEKHVELLHSQKFRFDAVFFARAKKVKNIKHSERLENKEDIP
jgi:hypothetical protein